MAASRPVYHCALAPTGKFGIESLVCPHHWQAERVVCAAGEPRFASAGMCGANLDANATLQLLKDGLQAAESTVRRIERR